MADGRKLDDAHVQKLQTNVIDRYDNVKKHLQKLAGMRIDMIEANWTGFGANTFEADGAEINEHMAGIGRMLDDFPEWNPAHQAGQEQARGRTPLQVGVEVDAGCEDVALQPLLTGPEFAPGP